MKEIALNKGADQLSLRITASLSAAAVEDLISELGRARARMSPAVPETFEQAMRGDAGLLDLGGLPARFSIEGQSLRVFIRSASIGWITMLFGANVVTDLRSLLGIEIPKGAARLN